MQITRVSLVAALAVATILSGQGAWAATPANTLGRIVLQTEQQGQAWYVKPDTGERYYLPDGETAYTFLEDFGLGITNADLARIPVGSQLVQDTDSDGDLMSDRIEEALGLGINDPDSDNDGFNDFTEVMNNYNPFGTGMMATDASFAAGLSGKILLQVESRGQAWYVNPVDHKRYYMKDGATAYQMMRFLSLGITDADLAGIAIGTGSKMPVAAGYVNLHVDNNLAAGNDFELMLSDDMFYQLQGTTLRIQNYDTALDVMPAGSFFMYVTQDTAGSEFESSYATTTDTTLAGVAAVRGDASNADDPYWNSAFTRGYYVSSKDLMFTINPLDEAGRVAADALLANLEWIVD